MAHILVNHGQSREEPRLSWLTSGGPTLQVRLDSTPQLLIVRLFGRLDARARTPLRFILRDSFTQHPARVLIDASGLISCDVLGLTGLVEGLGRAASDAIPVAVSSPPPGLWDLATQRKLSVQTFESFEEAVDTLMSSSGAHPPGQRELLTELRSLHRATLTRADIEQAKGILMVVYGLRPEAAFSMLVWHSRNARLAVHELATRLLDATDGMEPGSLTIPVADALLADLAVQPPRTDPEGVCIRR
jgi:hypothetical protein